MDQFSLGKTFPLPLNRSGLAVYGCCCLLNVRVDRSRRVLDALCLVSVCAASSDQCKFSL
jgi:hypothetical protein